MDNSLVLGLEKMMKADLGVLILVVMDNSLVLNDALQYVIDNKS